MAWIEASLIRERDRLIIDGEAVPIWVTAPAFDDEDGQVRISIISPSGELENRYYEPSEMLEVE